MKQKTSIEKRDTSNQIGRPLKFTPQELAQKIEDYFQFCEANNRVATVTGLAVELGTSRTLLARYKGLPKFEEIIEGAKTRIESLIEEGMLKNRLNVAASIFSLKNNFMWQDTVQIQQTGVIYRISITDPQDVTLDGEVIE